MQRLLLPPRTSHVIAVQAQEAGCPCSDKEPDPDWRVGDGPHKNKRPPRNKVKNPSPNHSLPQEKKEQVFPRVSCEALPHPQRQVEALPESQTARRPRPPPP